MSEGQKTNPPCADRKHNGEILPTRLPGSLLVYHSWGPGVVFCSKESSVWNVYRGQWSRPCLIYEHRKQDYLFVWFCTPASHTQTILYQPITFTWFYTFSLEYNFPLSHCLWLSNPIHQQRWNQHFSSSNITVFPFHSIPQEISPKLLNHHHSLPSRLSFIKYQRLIVSLETKLNTLRNW